MIGTAVEGARSRRWRALSAPEPLGLWLVDLAQAPDRVALTALTDREWARAARFRNAADGHRYVAAHAAVRGLIAEQCGVTVVRQRFDWSVFGKWRLVGAPGWDFNLSYSGDTALVGIAAGCAVGVDLERRRPTPDARALARLHFTRAECDALTGLRGTAQDAAFLRGWTRKEACVKALGIGLTAPLTQLETGVDDACCTARYRECAIDIGSATMEGPLIGAWALAAPQ